MRKQTAEAVEREAIRALCMIQDHCGLTSQTNCFSCDRRYLLLTKLLRRLALLSFPVFEGETCKIEKFTISPEKDIEVTVKMSRSGTRELVITNLHISDVVRQYKEQDEDE